MNALAVILPVSEKPIGEELKKTVNARRLHAWLGVGKDFSNWIKDRIEKYGFQEDGDFILCEDLRSPNSASSKSRPQKLKEYHITTDMAKELAMVENNTKGREARQYFIAVEKQASQPKTRIQKYEEILAAALHYREEAMRREELMNLAMPVNMHLYGTTDENGKVYNGLRRATITRSISRMREAAKLHILQMEMIQLLEDME